MREFILGTTKTIVGLIIIIPTAIAIMSVVMVNMFDATNTTIIGQAQTQSIYHGIDIVFPYAIIIFAIGGIIGIIIYAVMGGPPRIPGGTNLESYLNK